MEKILMDRACSTHGEGKLLFDRFVEKPVCTFDVSVTVHP